MARTFDAYKLARYLQKILHYYIIFKESIRKNLVFILGFDFEFFKF